MNEKKDLKKILKETIEKKSDFSFEMRILEHTQKTKFDSEHSGTYLDPYTNFNREFDIRAYKTIGKSRHLQLAVECKNVSVDFPLIVHSTKITKSEKIHTLIINHSGYKEERSVEHSDGFSTFRVSPASSDLSPMSNFYAYQRSFSHQVQYRVKDGNNIFPSLYSDFEYVGRSMDKLKMKGQGKTLEYTLNDGEIYDKFSQCQNSLIDLIESVACKIFSDGAHQFALFPILVVPNGTIWEQRYNPDGTKAEEIKQVDRIPFYVDKLYGQELHQHTPSHLIRFVEIVTENGFTDLLPILEGEEDRNLPTFLLEKELQEVIKKEKEG